MRRLSTGVTALDLVLGGGLPPGSVVMISGPPGTGKTILAQQICFANATADHKAIYYTTLSEPYSKIIGHLETFSFFDRAALDTTVEHLHLGDLLRQAPTDGLTPLIDEVVREALDDQPALVVIDSVKMLHDFVDPPRLRAALYDLTSRVAHSGTVLLLLGEYTSEEIRAGVEFSLADGILELSYQPREPVDRRWLRVIKMRGGTHLAGKHTFQIGPDGFTVHPRIEETSPPAPQTTFTGREPTGIPGLDALTGGGLPVGDATLVIGPSGVGKTIFSLAYTAQGLTAGQRALYITFQDTADQLVGMAEGFGWDFRTAHAENHLMISHVPMGNLDLDILASVMGDRLASGPVARVVIDSLAELASAAREAERFPAYLRALVGLVRAAGASLLVTSETTLFGPVKAPLDELMFLFHNLIQLRYLEQPPRLNRAINVLKMRNSHHDNTMYSCQITSRGLTVGQPLTDVTGLLGWSTLTTVTPLAHTPNPPRG